MSHFLTADRIHDGRRWLPEGSILEVADNGVILNVSAGSAAPATYYSGYLVPGFVNAHCHLELSHLKGAVPQGTGLIPFLQAVPTTRNKFSDAEKAAARESALREMYVNGVVAVGDIANTAESADLRQLDLMHIHTFVECIGFMPARAEKAFANSQQVLDVFAQFAAGRKMTKQSIAPHAPYSVSEPLFRLIGAYMPDVVTTVHNQECEAENEFYTERIGHVLSLLDNLGIDYSGFIPSGKTSLQTYGDWLPPQRKMLLVHNTFSSADDIAYAKQKFTDVWWCLCPNANLYIEGRLPQLDMIAAASDNICIGTDSLASNYQLSVMSELLTIQAFIPELSWERLLQWGTLNGARALELDGLLGSFEVGKQPGIIHLSSLDANCRISPLFH